MKTYKMITLLLAVSVTIGVSGWLIAAPPATTRPAAATTDDVDSAQQAMQRLIDQGPPVTTPTIPGANRNPNAPLPAPAKGQEKLLAAPPTILTQSKGQIKHKILPEGHYIADRRGRLICAGDYWLFVFESDGKSLADPPVKVLPNRWLEKMESDVAASHEPIIFRVSGEITAYRGQNFLLLRKVLIERETDGLK